MNTNVKKAKNGVEALKFLDESHYDLVLLDVMMPKMDGRETLKRIREKYNIPVIMVTAKTSEKDKVRRFFTLPFFLHRRAFGDIIGFVG